MKKLLGVAEWVASILLIIGALLVIAFASGAALGEWYPQLLWSVPLVMACCWSLDWISSHE